MPIIPNECVHNGYMVYIKSKNLGERTNLINYLNDNDIMSVFHYILLYNESAGQKFGRFFDGGWFTTTESERLVMLSMYYGMGDDIIDMFISCVKKFYTRLPQFSLLIVM